MPMMQTHAVSKTMKLFLFLIVPVILQLIKQREALGETVEQLRVERGSAGATFSKQAAHLSQQTRTTGRA